MSDNSFLNVLNKKEVVMLRGQKTAKSLPHISNSNDDKLNYYKMKKYTISL